MAQVQATGKRELIDRTNSKMVGIVALAAFLTVFSIIASRALLSQRSYQAEVIGEKEKAVKQLVENKTAVEELEVSYRAFVERQDNIIGGNSQGDGDRDGDNAKIVLDALPSKYDYPALITSIEKLMDTGGFTLKSISGSDEEVAETDSTESEPVMMPFELSTEVNGYNRVNEFLTTLYWSIRPVDMNQLTISGSGDTTIQVSIDGFTYYQPAKGLTIDKKVVK